MNPLQRYANWLHLKWPAGKVEKLPKVDELGRSSVPGIYVVGDLSGIPLLKMSLQTGADAVRDQMGNDRPGEIDLVIIGGGVAGVSAAAEAKKQGLSHVLLESSQLFSTIANFPKKKPIYTYPTDMNPESAIGVKADVKEALLEELQEQVQELDIEATPAMADKIEKTPQGLKVILKEGEPLIAKTVIVAIGRSGNYRKMNILGEDLDKVNNRLHDPASYIGKHTCVVGGGDSACEAAISIAAENERVGQKEALVSLVYRGAELSRPKPENVHQVMAYAQRGLLDLRLGTQPASISDATIELQAKGQKKESIPNDQVLSLIGREAPLDFFRRSGIAIHGEHQPAMKALLGSILLFITMLYAMKTLGWFRGSSIYLGNIGQSFSGTFSDPSSFLGSLAIQAKDAGFFVTLLYSTAVVSFGIDRMRRRKTPYVKLQTLTLMAIQCIPLFIIPELLLPWADRNGWVPEAIMEGLFTGYYYNSDGSIGSYDAYWHVYGFILAWPLMAWIVFSPVPLTWWLAISFIQTFVIIPFIIWRWGKGAYCGWICSCGALAETMGDRHREKMPHGPFWNKLNFIGQALLFLAFGLLLLHVIMWVANPGQGWQWVQVYGMKGFWKPVVDFMLAGALGTGLYFIYSGRVWCRFACPLAALMHIFARFSRFRIVVEQKKCISCNACTSACHQGIDIMNFANKGNHMEDPECVRCSACVQTCPTGVLQFGQVDATGQKVVSLDSLPASPVVMKENSKGS